MTRCVKKPSVRRADVRRTGIVLARIAALAPFAITLHMATKIWWFAPASRDLGALLTFVLVHAAPFALVWWCSGSLVDWWLRSPIPVRVAKAAMFVGALGVYLHADYGSRIAYLFLIWWWSKGWERGAGPLVAAPPEWLVGFAIGSALCIACQPVTAWLLRR